jgi:hypothetical protein
MWTIAQVNNHRHGQQRTISSRKASHATNHNKILPPPAKEVMNRVCSSLLSLVREGSHQQGQIRGEKRKYHKIYKPTEETSS